MRVLYIDVLVFVNAIIDYFLLLITARLFSNQPKRLRLALSAMLGGLTSLLVLAPRLPLGLQLLMKAFISAALILAAFGFSSLRAFLKHFLAHMAVTALFAGLLTALSKSEGGEAVYSNNLTFYIDLSPLLLVVSVTVCYGVICLAGLLLGSFGERQKTLGATLTMFGKSRRLSAMIDTGNRLKDPLSGRPVVIVAERFRHELLPEDYIALLDDCTAGRAPGTRLAGIRPIPFRAVGTEGLLYGVAADRCELEGGGEIRAPVVVFEPIDRDCPEIEMILGAKEEPDE